MVFIFAAYLIFDKETNKQKNICVHCFRVHRKPHPTSKLGCKAITYHGSWGLEAENRQEASLFAG